MKKKIMAVLVAVVLVFSVVAFAGCGGLGKYKADAKAEIEAYAEQKGEANYSAENWAVVMGVVGDGKAAVDEAKSEAEVDAAVDEAKTSINAVEKVAGAGKFYTLQEAFDKGWLTTQDLMNIAYYHGSLGGVNGAFIPTPKNPQMLSVNIAKKIEQDFVKYTNCQDDEHDIQIRYYGTYNGCVSAMIDGCQPYLDVEGLEGVDGVIFYYGSSQRILIWRETETAEDGKMVNQVKQTYVDEFLKAEHSETTVDDVMVTEYLGTYGGSFVAVLNDSYNRFFTDVEIPLIIDELDFSYSNGYPIRVWNSGKIYDFADAYEQELLTKENLQTIYSLYNNKTEQEKI